MRRGQAKDRPLAAHRIDDLAVRRYTLCAHPHCTRGSGELMRAMGRVSQRLGLEVSLERTLTLCDGNCGGGPYMGMPEKGLFYAGLKRGDVPLILTETTLAGRMIFDRLHLDPSEVTDPRVVYDWKRRVLVALEPDYCVVGLVYYLFVFNARESCGKCFPCRHGVYRLHRGLRALLEGGADESDLDQLRQVAETMTEGAYCEFAAKVATPVLMGLDNKADVFVSHLEKGCDPRERHL